MSARCSSTTSEGNYGTRIAGGDKGEQLLGDFIIRLDGAVSRKLVPRTKFAARAILISLRPTGLSIQKELCLIGNCIRQKSCSRATVVKLKPLDGMLAVLEARTQHITKHPIHGTSSANY